MGMNIHIRVKNDIAYGGKIGENIIYDFIENLEELQRKTKIDFIGDINGETNYIELSYSRFIEAYNNSQNHVQDIQELYKEAFNQAVCVEQDIIVIEYF